MPEKEKQSYAADLLIKCNPERISRIALGTRMKKDKNTGEYLKNESGGFIREPLEDVAWNGADKYPGVNRIITFYLPDARFQESKRFGPDAYGIDRDAQSPKMNVPSSYVHLNLINNETGKELFFKGEQGREAKNIMLGLNNKLYRRDTLEDVSDKYTLKGFYFYLVPDKEYNIYFDAKDSGRCGKGAKATGKEIHTMFAEERAKKKEQPTKAKNQNKEQVKKKSKETER